MRSEYLNQTKAIRVTRAAIAVMGLFVGLGAGVARGQGGLVINEFMADNGHTLTNKLGSTSDWIELYNGTGSATNLAGWHLTDNAGNLGKWTFPSTNVAAGAYLLVFASGNDGVFLGQLHSNFKLTKDAGGYLALVSPSISIVSECTNYPAQEADVSFGIATNTPDGVGYFTRPSPGAANSNGLVAVVADLQFSVDSGLFFTNFYAALTTTTAGAEIRYTTDCSVPATSSALYTNAIPITNSTVLRACAFKYGHIPADTGTRSYLFPAQVLRQPPNPAGFPTNWVGLDGINYAADYAMDPIIVTNPAYAPFMTNALRAVPFLSIATVLTNLFDRTNGIYVNPTQEGWERVASAEWVTTSNRTLFNAGCGLRIQGGAIRSMSASRKKSLRIDFQSIYGPAELEADLFGDPTAARKFDKVVLRAGAQDAFFAGGMFLQNGFADRTLQAMGWPSVHVTYVHLYLNGLYWGLYNPAEHISGYFGETYYGGTKTNWDLLTKSGWEEGDAQAWNALGALCNAGLADNASYQKVQGRNPDGTRNTAYPVYLDIPHYIDYHILEHWIAIGDWHQIAMRNRDNATSTGFRFPIWDSDYSLSDLYANLTGQGLQGYSALLENAEYRLLYADRIYRHMFNGGVLTTNQTLPRFRELTAILDPALLGESARWGDQANNGSRYTIDGWRALTSSTYAGFLSQRTAVEIPQYRQIGLYPSIDPPVFSQQGGVFSNGFLLTMTSTNAVYYTLDGVDPREYGTGNPIGLLAMGPVPLQYSVHVKARARSAAGEWSALNEADFIKAGVASQLRITEVMYHPRKPAGTETNGGWNEDDLQFIELLNAGQQPVVLAGMRLTDGGSFDFSDGAVSRLLPGEYAVVVKNKAAFTNRYAALMPIRIAGEFKRVLDFPQSGLSHNGETVTLKDATNGVVARFTYGDGRDWPAAADGAGHSLVPLPTMIADQANGALDYGGNWRASAYRDGSPGRADPNPAADVVLNEIMAHTDFTNAWDSNDWIEFYNPNTGTVYFTTNWYLSDDPEDLKKWMIPGASSVAGTNWVTFFEQTGFHFPTNTGFGLSKAGDAVYLSYLAGSVTDRVADCVRFKAQANFRAWGRYPDGASHWYTTLPTTNRANALATNTVAINEIMYHPATNANYPVDNGDIEYVELYNPGTASVTLTNEGGACRLSGGVSYTFPMNTAIPPGDYLALVSFDPSTNSPARAAFLASYGLTNGQVRLMGPYSGRLSDGGDRVAVEFPLLGDLPGDEVSWVIMDEVYYSDRLPWPEKADGSGYSLNRLRTWQAGNDPVNWMDGVPTPGASNAVSATTPMPVVGVTSVSVPEGGTNTFKVWLSAAPAGSATVTVSRISGDTNLSVQAGASLVFSSGSTTQAVTLAASPDDDAADGVATFLCAGANGAGVAVAATEVDRDVWVTVSGSGPLGTVSPSEPVAATNGGSVVISAQANPGYAFTAWSVVSGAATIGDPNAATTSVSVSGPAVLRGSFTVDVFTCSIAVPSNRLIKLGTSLTIQAATFSSPRACTVTNIDFYANGSKFGTATNAPYTCQWTAAAAGMYALTARAADNLGRISVSPAEYAAVFAQDGVTAMGGRGTKYTLNGTNYTAHVFTNSGPLVVAPGVGVEALLVAGGGGGGGGWEGGGGGAGGVRLWSGTLGGAYSITVGAGGNGALVSGDGGASGMPSSIVGPGLSNSAAGGGRGCAELSGLPSSKYIYPGAAGGSGGGGGWGSSNTGGAGTPGQGNAGGNANNDYNIPQGGGGGAGSAGQAGIQGGTGGVGIAVSYSGLPVTYATGGNGCKRYASPTDGAGAAANTGNGGHAGGGGITAKGGSGGSGIVIVRYVDAAPFNVSVTATAGTAKWPVLVGVFTIARPADASTNCEAVVNYTMSGTAVNGTDYSAIPVTNSSTGYSTPAPVALSGNLAFGAGVTSVTVNVYPLYNPSAPAKTATMTLSVAGSPAANITFPAWDVGTGPAVVSATGSAATNYVEQGTNYVAHIFTNTATAGTLTVASGGTVEYLLVGGGGGGGGGWNGGGGGGGGVRFGTVPLPVGTYTVTVGAGGPGANRLGSQVPGSNGLPSVLSAAVGVIGATGGGRGGSESPTYGAGSGGSGGGSSGGAVGGDLGNNGGAGTQFWPGGGGGARTVGGTGANNVQGLGGAGTNLAFSGVPVEYARGGYGCAGRVGRDGANALANTGNGGGGGDGGTAYKGGNGGSGIVIVRYVAGGAGVAAAAPSGLTAVASGTNRMSLTWADNATNETAYVVNRSSDSNQWILVTQTGANATNYDDSGLATGTQYYYRVAASNAAGVSAYAYASARTWTVYEAWQRGYFTQAQLTNTAVSGDTADPDQDGLNNGQEYLAGTDPTNAASSLVFVATTNSQVAGGPFVMRWQSVSGKTYTVMAATNLLTGFDNLATNIAGIPPVNVHTDSVSGVGSRFYRVKVE